MSFRIDSSTLKKDKPNKEWWINSYNPGDEVPVSGIYRCTGCGKEITSNKNDPFPPQNHHQHSQDQGSVKWKLNVKTDTTNEDKTENILRNFLLNG